MKKKSLGQQLHEALNKAYLKEYPGYIPENWDDLEDSNQAYYQEAAERLHKNWTRKKS